MAETHIQIGDVSPRIQYTGDGTQTVFTYPFPVFTTADMEVYLDQVKQGAGFSVNGAGQSAGGDVIFDIAPASNVLVTLRRRLAIQRTSDFQESGEFRAKVINDELDYQTAALQQVADDQKRSLRQGATDTATIAEIPDKTARASKFLGFDADGDPVASAGPTGGVTVSGFGETLVDDADAAAARTTLGLGSAAVEDVAAGGAGDLLRADGDGSGLTGIATGATDAEKTNIILNAFRIAVNGGLSVQDMVDGVVDEFEDETGIDNAASTNETYDAAGDFYTSNPGGYGADQIPAMTSNTAPSGTASALNGDATAWQAMNDDGLTLKWSSGNQNSDIKYDFGSGVTKVATQYTVMGQAANNDPKNWTFEGSNNDSDWDVLDTRTNETGWGSAEVRSYTFANATAYRYYRLSITATGGGNIQVSEWEIMEDAAPVDMTLVSEAATAEAQPDEAFVVIWQEDVDAVTLNTDLTAEASRDGGTTWTAVTLAEQATLTAGRILTGSADISAQPAGTSMKYRLKTLNTKEQKIHGVGLEWS